MVHTAEPQGITLSGFEKPLKADMKHHRNRAFPILSCVFALALLLAGCTGAGDDGERIGRATGTVVGATVAADAAKDSPPAVRAAAIVLGAFIGSWLGGEIGKEFDELDRIYAERALEDGLDNNPDGEPVIWSNPDSGNSGSAVPTRTEPSEDGADCRDFETTVVIDGQEEQTSGRACKQPDGSWKIVSGESA